MCRSTSHLTCSSPFLRTDFPVAQIEMLLRELQNFERVGRCKLCHLWLEKRDLSAPYASTLCAIKIHPGAGWGQKKSCGFICCDEDFGERCYSPPSERHRTEAGCTAFSHVLSAVILVGLWVPCLAGCEGVLQIIEEYAVGLEGCYASDLRRCKVCGDMHLPGAQC